MLKRLVWFMVLIGAGLLTAGNLVLLLVAGVLFKTLDKEYASQGLGAILNVWSEYVAWPLVLICAGGLILKCLGRLFKGQTNWFIAQLIFAVVLVGVQWYSVNLVKEATAVRSEIRENEAQQPWRTLDSSGPYIPEALKNSDQLSILRETFEKLHKDSTNAFIALTLMSLIISLVSSIYIIFVRDKKGELKMPKDDNGGAKGKRDAAVFS